MRHGTHGSTATRVSIHHRGVELVCPGRGIDGSATGVEERVVLQRAHGRLHGVERRAIGLEHHARSSQRVGQTSPARRLALRVAALHHACAAMDCNGISMMVGRGSCRVRGG